MQHVRRPTLDESLALLDAESMLLVDHRHREPRQLDALLNQRVRANNELRVGIALDGAREQRDAHPELRAQRFDREEVLLGERLRRRHQRALPLSLDRAQQRIERDDGLSRSDVALQQSLHRHRAVEIRVDVGDCALLVLGQLERERRAVAREQLSRFTERLGDRRLARADGARDAELENEQLLEGEPHACALRLLERTRPVESMQRVDLQRQALLLPQRRGERIRDVPRERGEHELAQLLRRHVLAGGIDGDEFGVPGRRLVRPHSEGAATKRADQPQSHSGSKLLRDPRLVEPRRADLT